MKTTLWIIGGIIFICLLAEIKIQFNPFSFSFIKPWRAVGIILITIGISCMEYDSYKRGVLDAKDTIIKVLEDFKNEKQS